MNLKQALQMGTGILKDAGAEEAAADAGILLCQAADCDRTFLYAHGNDILDSRALQEYIKLLEKRSDGMPVQYITGFCEFMSLKFAVRQGVLIPRQDTEILVEYAIDFCKRPGKRTEILDLCTGSGCIAVSLAHFIGDCSVTASDISQTAISVAGENAEANGVADRVGFIRTSLFEGLKGKRFDVIVSNPPYIPSGDISGLQREVRGYEPPEALDGGEDGLSFYRAIAGQASEYMTASGMLAMEVGIGQAHAVSRMLEKDFSDIAVIKDLAGIDRVVAGIRK